MEIVWSLSRYVLPVITVVILVKCIMTLMLGHPKEKIYGYIVDLTGGEKYALNMWETSVGRSKSCDIVLPYDSVARSHAVITRRIDGWYVHDLMTKAELKVNGHNVEQKAIIKNGDHIEFGRKRFRFEVVNDPVQNVGRKTSRSAAKGKTVRPTSQPAPGRKSPTTKSNTAHYSENNKPELKFEKSGTTAPTYSQRRDSFTVETGSRPQPKKKTKKHPRIVNGETGETFLLCGNEVTIGRGRRCDIRLKSDGVQKNHCLLILCENGWAIEEEEGDVYLNGRALKSSQILFSNDTIGIGEERLRYFE